jgi:hypothetical protein
MVLLDEHNLSFRSSPSSPLLVCSQKEQGGNFMPASYPIDELASGCRLPHALHSKPGGDQRVEVGAQHPMVFSEAAADPSRVA